MHRKTNQISRSCIFLVLLVMIKASVVPMIYLDYELRRDYITKNICINRAKPSMHCEGKCYLSRKLAQNQREDQKSAESEYLASLIYQVTEPEGPAYQFLATCSKTLEKVTIFLYISNFSPSGFYQGIFRPPVHSGCDNLI